MKLIRSLVFFFICLNVSGQSKIPTYKIESGLSVSLGRQTPFWLMSNQYGLFTPDKFNSFLKAGFSSSPDSAKKIDFSYGLDVVNRYTTKYDIYLHQCYFRSKLWFVNVQAGSIEEKFGNQDYELSSGGLLWSGNARPMPKITLNVPEYVYIPIPYFKKFIEFKGGISHGWFGDDEFTKDTWLHHKYVYFQAGGKFPVHVHYGFHHFAQWGGVSRDDSIGKLPSGISDFIKIFLARSGEGSIPSSLNEGSNKIGNHIGSRNFGLDVALKKYKISAYWQTIFEDGTGRAYRNIADGLWGISVHSNDYKNIVNGICIEYLQTTDQSGPSHLPSPGFPKGGGDDNYFNNWIYRAGWTYKAMIIGTPLITSPVIFRGDSLNYIGNNKVKAIHTGVSGIYGKVEYKIFYTYSQNYGINNTPFDSYKKQNSILIQTYLKDLLPWRTDLMIRIGTDIGKMYGNNWGIMISVVKKDIF